MKLFSLIQLRYDQFENAIRNALSKALGSENVPFSNSNIFGQLINVVSSATQNILSYIEDGITEQNKFTASRKRSLYNLAAISGYHPSLGTATSALVRVSFKPNNLKSLSVVLKNHTTIVCDQNGLTYNIILPQEAIVLSPNYDNISKYLSIVEGRFEEQSFIVNGGQLYTETILFNGDADLDYLEVYVNNEKWERMPSLYDMEPEAKQYSVRTSLDKGFDLIFGDTQNGKELKEGDVIRVSYLLHSGEYGNIDSSKPVSFEFSQNLTDISGEEIDGNEMFIIKLQAQENVNSGTFSEDINKVREMIGLNSRSLVLADAKNYKQFFNKFSFVGYNRTWSERGSLIINSLIIKNYKTNLQNGKDYFKLNESDFILSDTQKQSIINNITNSGQQLAGAVINIFDPEIAKYAMYIYIKLKSDSYDTDYISNQIRTLIGDFMSNEINDIFIPKSDITKLIKDNIEAVDGVDVYFLSQLNEQALMNHSYEEKTYQYNPSTGTYDIKVQKI